MRKSSKAAYSTPDRNTMRKVFLGSQPNRVTGAVITTRRRPVGINFEDMLTNSDTGATIAGTGYKMAAEPDYTETARTGTGTVALSDGTRIRFATATQFDGVE